MYLTGLIIDKTETLSYIKEMFDRFASHNNLQIDYYCHFWSSENLYPYTIDYHTTKINVPWENQGSVQHAIDIFNPVDYTISNFTDMYYHFLKYYKSKYSENNWISQSIDNDIDKFINKNIHSDYFVENFEYPADMFDKWWHLHVNWCQYIHVLSQAFTASQATKLIKDSNQQYDACIKWRYDVIADLITYNDKVLDAIKHCSKIENTLYTELAWEGVEWTEDLPYDINTIDNDKVISLHDGWWISSLYTSHLISENLLTYYTNDILSNSNTGQHISFFNSIKNIKSNIYLTDRINSNIIRYPDTIPEDYNNRPWDYFHVLYAKNFSTKKASDYKNQLEYWDKRSQYHTIKYFNFY